MIKVETEAPALGRNSSATATPSTLDKRAAPRLYHCLKAAQLITWMVLYNVWYSIKRRQQSSKMQNTEQELSLDLKLLSTGKLGVSAHFGRMLIEVGSICLESQGHASGTKLSVQGADRGQFVLTWPSPDERANYTYQDNEATEYGAVGVALVLIWQVKGYTVIEPARTGSGFDYWIGNESLHNPIQRKACLEISGIRCGDARTIRARIRQKQQRTAQSKDLIHPIYVIVIEFGGPIAEIQKTPPGGGL